MKLKVKLSIFIPLFLLVVSNQPAHGRKNCQNQSKLLEKVAPYVPNFIKYQALAGYHALKGGWSLYISQFTFPINLVRHGVAKFRGQKSSVWATRVTFSKDGVRALSGYLLYQLIPDSLVLSIVDVHSETDDEFMNLSSEDVVVVVDGFSEKESWPYRVNKTLIKVIAEERRLQGLNVHHVEPEDWSDLARTMNRIRRSERRKISRLDIYAHGTPFSMNLNGSSYSEWSLDSDDFNGLGVPAHSHFFSLLRFDIMKPDSIMRFNGCHVGQNESFLTRFGERLFFSGGTIFASKVLNTWSGTHEVLEYTLGTEMPDWLGHLQNRVFGGPVKLASAAWAKWNHSDLSRPSLDNVVKIRIQPRN